ncbi:MAG: hypothetical protein ACTSRG_23660 [Candidatus Helarchaeota archaeon]
MEVYNVSLSREGLIEIGETIKVSGLYTLNYSPRYIVLENWLDIGDYPVEYHNIPNLVENFTANIDVTLDPERFEVNESNPLHGKLMLKILDLETSFIYTKQNKSNNFIRLTKAQVNYTITNQCPKVILNSKTTNISFNFFNSHNSDFKLRNSFVQFILYDPKDNIVQNENFSTSENGDINILLKTNSSKDGGNYSLIIITQENELYASTNYIVPFKVYNESNVFNGSISDNSIYTSVPYDPIFLELTAETQFNSNISWNSSFSSGNFTKIQNFTYLSNLSAPMYANNYTINIWATLEGTNTTLKRKINLTVKERPIEINLTFKKIIFSRKIELKAIVIDNLTYHQIINGQIFNFYILNKSIWEFIGRSKTYEGKAILYWNLPDNFYMDRLNVMVKIFNSSIYENLSFFREMRFTDLKVLTLPNAKILSFFPILINLKIFNITNMTNEYIQIFINSFKMYNIKIKANQANLIYFMAPAVETKLNFLIVYEGTNINLNSDFIFELNIISDFIKVILGNLWFFISLSISIFFTIIYVKNRNLRCLNKLKIYVEE